MERTPESAEARAAPRVPDDTESAAEGWSMSPHEPLRNEKGGPYKMCSVHSSAPKSERSKKVVCVRLMRSSDPLTTRSISPGKRLCRAMLEHVAGVWRQIEDEIFAQVFIVRITDRVEQDPLSDFTFFQTPG